MDSAIIGPIKYLNQLDQAYGTGFHICYISLVYEYKQYRNFYRSKSRQGDKVILDFSNVTPRDRPPRYMIYLIKSAIEYIKPFAVILPDSDLHLKKTLQSAEDTISFLRKSLGNIPVIGMIQGISEDQYSQCLETYKQISLDYPLVGIGLPSSMEKIIPRHKFITDIYQPCEFGLPLYMSEIFDGTREISAIKNNELIESDLVQGGWSTIPIRLAYNNQPLPKVGTIRPSPRPLTYLEDYIPELIVDNIETYLGIYNGRR
jgi:hypothetical protein